MAETTDNHLNNINEQRNEAEETRLNTPNTRKRKRCERLWKKNVEKRARHLPKGFPKLPQCTHGKKTFRCHELSIQDVRKIHQRYYFEADLQWKKNYILQNVSVSSPKTSSIATSRRKVRIKFELPKQNGDHVENIKVCRSAFLSILQESRDRVNLLCRKYLQTGTTPSETRGGDRRSHLYDDKLLAVKNFIRAFVPLQCHYSRAKNRKRQYLDSDLSIQKMWRLYLERFSNDSSKYVKYDYFRNIFTENFNIGFGSPYTDKCSTCCTFENKLAEEKDKIKKSNLNHEFAAHKKRADTFYEKIRNKTDGELIMSYDCQKNLVLPKVPDQAAYYARQIYLYNFTICQGSSISIQNKSNTFAYIWTENEYAKGSNQVVSAVHHRLNNTDLSDISTVKLFSDGCGGQNKNKTMIGMIAHWFHSEAPPSVRKIEIMFPIVGHSFIPPDRVFGNLEREFTKKSVIKNPDEYLEVIRKRSTVVHLGEDCDVKDWKLYSEDTLKQPGAWHFQFQKAKRIIFTRDKSKRSVLIQGEPFYNFEWGEAKSVCKRGKTLNKRVIEIPNIIKGVHLSDAKVNDVKKLLVLHFGDKWAENGDLTFFKNIFGAHVTEIGENQATEDEIDFELMDEPDDGEKC